MTEHDPELREAFDKFADCFYRLREQAGRLASDGPLASPVAVLDLNKARLRLRENAREVETLFEKKGIPDTEGKLCKMVMEETDPERIRIEMLNTYDAVARQTNLEQVLVSPPAPSSTLVRSHATPRPEPAHKSLKSKKPAEPPTARKRTDNLKRAIFDAFAKGMPATASASEVFNYLLNNDDTGYIQGRDGDELSWVNTAGGISRTTLAKLAERLTKYRREYEGDV